MELVRAAYHKLPDALQRAVLVRRRQPIWIEAGIVFIHVPKAAGTSISEALYGRFMGHARASDVRRWGSPKLRSLPSFAVTRNPWSRLVSTYRFLRRGHGIGGASGTVTKAEQYQVPECSTFERFVLEWLAPRDVTKLDMALQPQTLYVHDTAGNVLVDHLGRLEQMEPTYAFIRADVPNFKALTRSNRSGETIDYRTFYSDELIEAVRSIYRKDIEAFGYDFE